MYGFPDKIHEILCVIPNPEEISKNTCNSLIVNSFKLYLCITKNSIKTPLSGFPDNLYRAIAAYVPMFILSVYKTLVVYINYNTHQAL
jgi:hypothetical protein